MESIETSGEPQRQATVGPVDETRPASAFEPGLGRTVLLPLGFAVAFATRYGLGTSMTVAVGAAAPLIVLFAAAPALAAASARRFEGALASALATGDAPRLQAAWAQARLFRWFGPAAAVAEKRGLVAAVAGDPLAARRAYGEARAAHGAHAPLGVELGYGDACYALGDDAEATKAYRRVLAIDPTLHRVRRALAHALLRHGPAADAAEVLASCPEPPDPTEAHHYRLLRAAAYRAAGDPEAAKRWKKKAGRPRDDLARELAALGRAG